MRSGGKANRNLSGNNDMASLVLRDVSRKFRSTTAVRSVSLEIPSGEFFAILGPSGSGKTTLLRIIAGFERPDAGTIVMDGENITPLPPQRRGIGMVFQNYALFPHLSVFENVAFPLRARRVANAEIRERVGSALDGVQLRRKESAAVTALSGGEQQRVAIARALIIRPVLLLFDEPLSSLDISLRVQMREEIRSLQQRLRITSIYVTHDQGEAMALADRIGVMRDGQIEQQGTPQVLYEKPATPFIASFVGGATLVPGTYDSVGKIFRNGTFVLHDESSQTTCPSGPATLAVRPDAVRISGMGQSQLEGALVSIEYRGYIVAFRVRIGDIELSCVASGSHHLPEPGSRISFDLDPGACTLFGMEVR